jgi:hypothetical protein
LGKKKQKSLHSGPWPSEGMWLVLSGLGTQFRGLHELLNSHKTTESQPAKTDVRPRQACPSVLPTQVACSVMSFLFLRVILQVFLSFKKLYLLHRCPYNLRSLKFINFIISKHFYHVTWQLYSWLNFSCDLPN